MVIFNERKKEILLFLCESGGATARETSEALHINIGNAWVRLAYYWHHGKNNYIIRKKTNRGYKYCLNAKGRRVLKRLMEIPSSHPLRLYKKF